MQRRSACGAVAACAFLVPGQWPPPMSIFGVCPQSPNSMCGLSSTGSRKHSHQSATTRQQPTTPPAPASIVSARGIAIRTATVPTISLRATAPQARLSRLHLRAPPCLEHLPQVQVHITHRLAPSAAAPATTAAPATPAPPAAPRAIVTSLPSVSSLRLLLPNYCRDRLSGGRLVL